MASLHDDVSGYKKKNKSIVLSYSVTALENSQAAYGSTVLGLLGPVANDAAAGTSS